MVGTLYELRPESGATARRSRSIWASSTSARSTCWCRGFYSNRTDLIRTAIRNQLDRHAEAVKGSVARKRLDLGLRHYSRADLEAARAAGLPLDIHVLGSRQHRRRRHAGTGPRRHRFRHRAGRAAREPGRQGRPRRPHRLTPRHAPFSNQDLDDP